MSNHVLGERFITDGEIAFKIVDSVEKVAVSKSGLVNSLKMFCSTGEMKSIGEYQVLAMAGRSRSGSEPGGYLFHAVQGTKPYGDDMRVAVCGKSPGLRSAGWVVSGSVVTCPGCVRALAER